MKRILILGGTTEARRLAERLAPRANLTVTLSLAGRTATPAAQPVPVRIGGFGGAAGLAAFLEAQAIDVLIDATHPYAAQISAHAVVACSKTRVPLASLVRPAWTPQPGDAWQTVPTAVTAALALGKTPRRVFLSLGRQELHFFAAFPQHHYIARLI